MPVNMNTFWSDLGIISGNTSATNQYDLYKGLKFNDGFVCASQYDFFTHLGTNRYEFFKSYNSVDSNIVDEYTFYKNTSDPNIYDYRTFNQLAGSFISSTPVTPTPTPSATVTPTITPTPTLTPTSSVTPTPTPSPIPSPAMTFITSTNNTNNLTTYTFNSVDIGGPGLIVVVFGSEGGNGTASSFTSFTIGGEEATIVKQLNSVSGTDGNLAMAYKRITGGTTSDISVSLNQLQGRAAIGIWRIENNVSDTPITNATGLTNTTSVSTTLNSLSNNDFVISTILCGNAFNITWTNATQRFEQAPENVVFFEGADTTKSGDGNLTITGTVASSATQGLYMISAAWR